MSAKDRLLGTPYELGRINDLESIRKMGWAKIPTYYYDFVTHSLPFTQAEFDGLFGPNIPVFVENAPAPNRQTNAAVGSGVNTIFLACAVGVVAIGEGEAFAIHGMDVPAPTAGGTAQPAVVGSLAGCEGYCGAGTPPAGGRFATLWHGAPTWRFIEKFFQAYRLQLKVQRRFLMVDESLLDVGMTPLPPEFVGASDSKIPTMPFIRSANDVLREKGILRRFLTPNVTIIESASACLPPPLAGVTYGHPRIIGLANRIYPLCQPILFLPGMRFDVLFESVPNGACTRALRDSVVYDCITPDQDFSGAVLTSSGLDVFSSCGPVCTIPHGCISLGVVMKGIELWPQAAIQYLGEYVVPGGLLGTMYSELGSVQGLLAKANALGVGEAGRKAQGVLAARPQTVLLTPGQGE